MKKKFYSGVPIILPILFALIYLLAVVTRSKDEVYSILMGAPPSDPLIFSIVVGGIVLLLLWVWSEWVYYIEFGENELVFKREMLQFLKPVKVSYGEIFYVCRSDVKEVLSVFLLNGKEVRLPTSVTDGVDGLVAEFRKHLPSGRIQPEIETAYKKWGPFEKWNLVMVVLVILTIPYSIVGMSNKDIGSLIAWKGVWTPLGTLSGTVESYWVDPNQEVWASFSGLFSKDWKIAKLSSEYKKEIVLTFEDSLADRSNLVLADENDQPWVIQSDSLYHWNGQMWDEIKLTDYRIDTRRYPTTTEYKYWSYTYHGEESKYLFSLDLNTAEIKTYPFPNEFASSGFFVYDIRPVAGNSLVVMFTKEYGPIYFYRFENGEWKKVGEILDAEWVLPFPDSERPHFQFGGFTVDEKGQIWVVLERDSINTIGRLVIGEDQWSWSYIEKRCDLCGDLYEQIVVDRFQRVWLAVEFASRDQQSDTYAVHDGDGADVFMPVWNDTAVLMTRYSEKNSGYTGSPWRTGMKMSPDGKIWSGSRDGLVRIDASQIALVKPLPFESILISEPIMIILYPIAPALFGAFFRLFFRRYYLPPLPEKNS